MKPSIRRLVINAASRLVSEISPRQATTTAALALAAASGGLLSSACGDDGVDTHGGARGGGVNGEMVGPPTASAATTELIQEGQHIFRYWTFGDEQQWTDTLTINTVIESAVDPATALKVGLKVDMDALPTAVINGVLDGSIPLNDPQTTLALIQLNAVVGLKGTVTTGSDGKLHLDRVGTTCALCHSTVDNAGHAANANIPRGIGHRMDGWPNRDLNAGAIIALSPAVAGSANAAIYNSWGPGKYDPRFNIDGHDAPAPVIPPAFGLDDVHRIIFTGDGAELAYWNRYVGVTQMGGQGVFTDPRLPDPLKNSGRPINRDQRGTGADCAASIALAAHSAAGGESGTTITIAANNITDADQRVDCVSNYLPALQAYQLSIGAPVLSTLSDNAGLQDFATAHNLPTSFDATGAQRGETVFNGKASCDACHTGAQFTDANRMLHPADASVSADPSYVQRSASKMWRTSPLHGLWAHPPYFHDGSAATLADVVARYNDKLNLGLTPAEQSDLTEYLKSL
ncbi:MAG TPA: hypothetical protein VL326_22315 [Kofleriaceae bacterium]|nr:hypothetical protein [Kofleriaceae bacterium]